MMDDYKNSDNFQRTEGCKMILPHHSHPINGVGPSDVNHFCLIRRVGYCGVIVRLGIVFILSLVANLSLGDDLRLNAPKLVERSYYISSETNSRLLEAAESAGVKDSDLNKSIVPLSELFGVDWPEGSSVGTSSNINYICVRNTSENIEKFERFLSKAAVQPRNVEVDVKFIEAGRSALSAVGYFDGARTNAAIMLEKLLSRGDVKLLHAMRGVAKFGEQSVYKSVTEYYYPRCYDVEFIGKSLQCTNQGSSVSAVASPNNFHQEEFGAIVDVTVDETADRKMLYVEMRAYLRDRPEWKDFAFKARRQRGSDADFKVELPITPLRLEIESDLLVQSGETVVLGGLTDAHDKKRDVHVLIFATMRVLDEYGNEDKSYGRSMSCGKEVCREYPSSGMKAVSYFCGKSSIESDSFSTEEPKVLKSEMLAKRIEGWKALFTEEWGVQWPEGSSLKDLSGSLSLMWVKNTPENIAKITDGFEGLLKNKRVEMDVCCIEANEKVLKDLDYYSSNRVDAATLQKRLIAHSDAKLIADSHLIMDQGFEQLVKSTMEYRYPDYDMIFDNISSNQTDNAKNKWFGILDIVEKECGVIIEPLVSRRLLAEDLCDVELRVNIQGEPMWKSFGVKTIDLAPYGITMELPSFSRRTSFDTKFTVRSGVTTVFTENVIDAIGSRKTIFIFCTPRLR